jgi:hypothetical protein
MATRVRRRGRQPYSIVRKNLYVLPPILSSNVARDQGGSLCPSLHEFGCRAGYPETNVPAGRLAHSFRQDKV